MLLDLVVRTAVTVVLAFFGTLVVVDGDLSLICRYLAIPPHLTLDYHVPKPVTGVAFFGSAVAFKAYYLDAPVVQSQSIDTAHWSSNDIELMPHATPSTFQPNGPHPSFKPTPCTVTFEDGALDAFGLTRTLREDVALDVRNLVAILANLFYQTLKMAFIGITTFVRFAGFVVQVPRYIWESQTDISLTLAIGHWVWRLQGVHLLLALVAVPFLTGMPFVFANLAEHVEEHNGCDLHSVLAIADETPPTAFATLPPKDSVQTKPVFISTPDGGRHLKIEDVSLSMRPTQDPPVLADNRMEAVDVDVDLKDTLSPPVSPNAASNDLGLALALSPSDNGEREDKADGDVIVLVKSSSVAVLNGCQDLTVVNALMPSEKIVLDTADVGLLRALSTPLPRDLADVSVNLEFELVPDAPLYAVDGQADDIRKSPPVQPSSTLLLGDCEDLNVHDKLTRTIATLLPEDDVDWTVESQEADAIGSASRSPGFVHGEVDREADVAIIDNGNKDASAEDVADGGQPVWSFLYDEDSYLFRDAEKEVTGEGASEMRRNSVVFVAEANKDVVASSSPPRSRQPSFGTDLAFCLELMEALSFLPDDEAGYVPEQRHLHLPVPPPYIGTVFAIAPPRVPEDFNSIVFRRFHTVVRRLEAEAKLAHPTGDSHPSSSVALGGSFRYDPATDRVRTGLAAANELCGIRRTMLEAKAASRPVVTVIHGPPGPVAIPGQGQSSNAKKRRRQREAAAAATATLAGGL